jgi:hypothetical protein
VGNSWPCRTDSRNGGQYRLVEFIVWALLVISDPSFDFLKLERRHHTPM